MTPSELELQLELSHHARGLRAVARDLLRDEHAAEDVVQEAALCTLRARPAEPGSLGGWLVTVLRNLCFQHRRREQRRQRREQAASRTEQLPAAAEMAERRETLRRVTDAVLGLREPYQGALLLRYFEGLSPRQIARRTDTNVATVKSRLQRGLGLLRAQMDAGADRRRNQDDWRSTLAAAVGLPTGVTTTTTLVATGITLMGPAAKLGLVAAAVVASTALVWTFSGTATVEPVSPVAAHDEAPAVAPDAAADQARAPLESPEAVSQLHSPTDSPLHHPFAFDLQVDVVDRDGLPVANAQVQVAPPGCILTAWPERTGADGTVHVRFRGRQPGMELSVSTDGLRGQRRVQVQSAEPARVVLLAELQVGRYTRSRVVSLSYTLRSDGALDLAGEKVASSPARASLHPDAVFADPSAAGPVSVNRGYGGRMGGVELKLDGGKMTFGNVKTRSLEPEGQTGAEPVARITGIVCGEDGRPVPRCTVIWGKQLDRPLGRTVTDDQGAFAFAAVPPGPLKLRAGGGDGGLSRRDVLAVAGETSRWDARLERGTCVVGRALDQDGKPLAGWCVEFVGAAQLWADDCTVREDGSFELPNHPGGQGSLLLWSKDRNVRLPLLALHSVRPDDGPVLLRLDSRDASGQLELETPVPGGVAVSPVVRVWQEDTGRGCAMQPAAGGRHKLAQLPAGWYRVGIEGGVLGWLDGGRHWVDGRNVVQLGRVQLPTPGRLRIHRSKPAEANPQRPPLEQVCLRRPECDLRTFEDGKLESDVRLLAAGDYWFLWRDGAGVTRYQPFSIQSGGEALVLWRDDAPVLGK